MKIRASLLLTLALVLAQAAFGATISCANRPTSPVTVDTLDGPVLYSQFDCVDYRSSTPATASLTSLITNGGALFDTNAPGAAYIVAINGNPNTLADDGTGLFNQSLWEAILFFPGDQCSGFCSDSVTVTWKNDPTFSTVAANVKSFDQGLYTGGVNDPAIDPLFFVQFSNGYAVFAPDANHTYSLVPEPGSMMLLASGLAFLGGMAWKKRRTA